MIAEKMKPYLQNNSAIRAMFEEGKKTLNTYQMPYGNLVVGLDTKRILMIEEEEEITEEFDFSEEPVEESDYTNVYTYVIFK